MKKIKDILPPTLKVSQAAFISHKRRQYCVILDLSFRLHVNVKYLSSVKGATVKTDTQESMGQLGSTMKRLVAVMTDNYNMESPFIFTNINIAEKFWRLVVSHLQAWNLFYVIPATDDWQASLGETEIVLPTGLQMGWCESPQFFCEGSETARDRISDLVKGNTTPPRNKFENIMIPNSLNSTMPEKFVDIIEVFVDDFIDTTNNADLTHLLHLSRCILYGMHTTPTPS